MLLHRRCPALGVQRMPSVDVIRGTAMLLVILSHAAALINERTVPGLPFLLLIRVCNLASVAFVFLSGMMVSYFLAIRSDKDTVIRRFARRAFLLLFVVHPLIWFGSWFWSPGPASAMLHLWYVTDTIAVCLLIGPFLILMTGTRWKVVGIVGLLVSAVVLKAFWAPASVGLALLKEVTVGGLSAGHPLLPWLAVFLAGSLLGGSLARTGSTGQGVLVFGRRLEVVGTQLVLTGLAAVGVYKLARMVQADLWSPAFLAAVHPDRTTILFPLYVGILLWLFAGIIRLGHGASGFGRLAWFTSVFGRTSLFAFVIQSAFVWSLSAVAGLRNHVTIVTLWPLFAGFVAVIWIPCYVYGRLTNRIEADDFERFAGAVADGERRAAPSPLAEAVGGG